MLDGKTAFITGTNRGIGKAIVQEFAKNGANIIAHARRETPEFSEFLKQLSRQYGVEITPVYFDMTDRDAMKSEIRNIISANKPVHILVNNAAMPHGGLFAMTSMQKIREVFDVNFFAHLEITQQLLRWIIKSGGGSIINISSVSGINLLAGNCAYGTSKAALIAFTKTFASECGTNGVRVNAICPGLTDTDMGGQMKPENSLREIEKSAMKRKATPTEIAKVAVFLASDESAFINGQAIKVDGGGNDFFNFTHIGGLEHSNWACDTYFRHAELQENLGGMYA